MGWGGPRSVRNVVNLNGCLQKGEMMMSRKLRNGEEKMSPGPLLGCEATGKCLMVTMCPQEVR